jgi:hypothetical protein
MPLVTSLVTPFFAGLLFGTGLILSGMTNPVAALAVGGRPTLMFVAAMIAGMAVFEVVERLAQARE